MKRSMLRFCLLAVILSSSGLVLSIPEDYETVKTSNAALLNRLGLIQLLPNDGHHRKRLAGPDAFGARDAMRSHHHHHNNHHQQQQLQKSAHGRKHSNENNNNNNNNSNGTPPDSHVYVVKLPANSPYYSFLKPHKSNPEDDKNITKSDPGFKNNGKPDKIFHWNLPLVKKINEKKKHLALAKMEQMKKKLEAEKERLKVVEKMSYLKKLAQEQLVAETTHQQQLKRKPSRNNDKWLSDPEKIEPRIKSTGNATQLKIFSSVNEKQYRTVDNRHRHDNNNEKENERETSRSSHHHRLGNWHNNEASDKNDVPQQYQTSRNALTESQRAKKHKKKSAGGVSYYYAPALTGKSVSNSLSKHFPGNGKPKAFYVMEKSRKPIYYHPLLP